ncbi:Hypothetical Protein FCC1311_111412 [Hondaea fermentalgiana]|uniref:Cytidine deaminase n=1 Tax=Hondaea fermentalgiana TaxID=2315210 RepID=A0A2R5GYM4_9STRA|nr:Hypothetical Protein FCC1311_111412 [Hondaea fermentalgiana]|eukprot:GBG34918.1 Hypothetical Protein FCC1311_111412 [Hondaea fermentalgiana]
MSRHVRSGDSGAEPKRVEILVYNVSHVDIILGALRGDAAALAGSGASDLFYAAEGVGKTQILARPRFNRFYPLTSEIESALQELGDAARIIDCEYDPDEANEAEDADEGEEELKTCRKSSVESLSQQPTSPSESRHPHHRGNLMSPAKAAATAAVGVAAASGVGDPSSSSSSSSSSSTNASETALPSTSPRASANESAVIRATSLASCASTRSLLSLHGGPVILPVGFDFHERPIVEDSWDALSVRKGDDNGISDATNKQTPRLCSVMLPLVSQLLFTWLGIVEDTVSLDMEETNAADPEEDLQKVVFLVSGSGTPRNRALPVNSNSTKAAARIIKAFIERTCPSVEVVCLDSGLDIFHYDQNVRFCNDIVLPAIDTFRHPLVVHYGNEWQKRLGMTVALTDGSPARLAALNAALRQYRPSYLHMWQLKSFWYELRFLGKDLIFQSFETMETKPPVPISDLEPECRQVVDEMRKYKHEFVQAKAAGSLQELSAFWLRKTRKVVLSVLMVHMDNEEEPRFYRGMNLEVSMPTGSLCSERNVIGTALASNQTLGRREFRYIAVLSMTLDPPAPALPPSPSRHTVSRADNSTLAMDVSSRANTPQPNLGRSTSSRRSITDTTPENSPLLRPMSATNTGTNSRFQGELNPIQPCGACMEWLKKIAEVNPTFKVVTFPNSDCHEAFVQEIG